MPASEAGSVPLRPPGPDFKAAAAAKIIKENEAFPEHAAGFRATLLTDELRAKWDALCPLISANSKKEAEIAKVTGATISNPVELRREVLWEFLAEFLFDGTEAGQARQLAFYRKFQERLAVLMADAIPAIQEQMAQIRQAQLAAGNMSPEQMAALLEGQNIPPGLLNGG